MSPRGAVGGLGGPLAVGGPGGAGWDYGQQFLPSGLNRDWQSDNDMHHRREMLQHIVKLLKQMDKNASPEWLTKLPEMVTQLEVSLYRSAPSFEAYSDTSTLKTRLQQLAMEIASEAAALRFGRMSPPYEGTTAAQPQSSNQRGQMSVPPQGQMPPGTNNGAPQQQHQQQLAQMGNPNPYGGYPDQQQHLRGPGMNMQGGPGGNPGFMHQAPNQGHRNSMPPPMNIGHQYGNQGGYNPNFNQQGMPQQQQQQHPQYGHPQQHGYPPQQHMQQQQHGIVPGQQQQQQHGMPQQYGQQPNYGRQSSNSNAPGPSNPPDGQTSSGNGPLNFNAAPTNLSNPSPGAVLGGPLAGGGPGGAGWDYGQQFLPSGLNRDWQSDNDMHHRREMIQHIVKLLKQKDKNASLKKKKLPEMVTQLEVSLYRSAPSFEAYSDTSTLKTRLQQLAMEIAKKTQQAKDGSGGGGNRLSNETPGGMPSSSPFPPIIHTNQQQQHATCTKDIMGLSSDSTDD